MFPLCRGRAPSLSALRVATEHFYSLAATGIAGSDHSGDTLFADRRTSATRNARQRFREALTTSPTPKGVLDDIRGATAACQPGRVKRTDSEKRQTAGQAEI